MNDRAIKWLENRPKEEAETQRHRTRLGTALYYSERWEEAQGLFEELHKDYPDTITHLGILGTLAARRGDRDEALRISSILESLDRPYLFGAHTHWRACIAALFGEKELAVRLLQEAFAQGADVHLFDSDMDLEPLYDYPPFQELIKPKG